MPRMPKIDGYKVLCDNPHLLNRLIILCFLQLSGRLGCQEVARGESGTRGEGGGGGGGVGDGAAGPWAEVAGVDLGPEGEALGGLEDQVILRMDRGRRGGAGGQGAGAGSSQGWVFIGTANEDLTLG